MRTKARRIPVLRRYRVFNVLQCEGLDGKVPELPPDERSASERIEAAEAMDAVPGVRIAFEPKPYEPRGRILYGLTPEGVLLGHQVESLLAADENRRLLGVEGGVPDLPHGRDGDGPSGSGEDGAGLLLHLSGGVLDAGDRSGEGLQGEP